MNKGILLHFQKGEYTYEERENHPLGTINKVFFWKKTKELEIKYSGDGR